MNRVKKFQECIFERSAIKYSVELNWWIGNNEYMISTRFLSDYDNNKMQDFLNSVQLVSASLIIGNREEGIPENEINLSKHELMIFYDMVDELIPRLNGKFRDDIATGNFGISDFQMKYQNIQNGFNPRVQNEYFEKEIKRMREILNSDLKPTAIFHMLNKILKDIDSFGQKEKK